MTPPRPRDPEGVQITNREIYDLVVQSRDLAVILRRDVDAMSASVTKNTHTLDVVSGKVNSLNVKFYGILVPFLGMLMSLAYMLFKGTPT